MGELTSIFCLNSGSSSLKFAVFDRETPLIRGAVEGIGLTTGKVWLREQKKAVVEKKVAVACQVEALDCLFRVLAAVKPAVLPQVIGHRLVYGGAARSAHCLIGDSLLDQIRANIAWAPLHLPQELAVIKAMISRFPDKRQIACFDSAFYAQLPRLARQLPIPALESAPIERRGFHGLVFESILAQLKDVTGKWIFAHLGSGVSVIAVKEKVPIDMTMGFSPTSGVMMGTRSGDLDPGILLYLIREKGYNIEQLERFFSAESGLLGVSGLSSDMKILLQAGKEKPQAKVAVDLFCYHIVKAIGALVPVLGGLDGIVFTGGIGTHSPEIRAAICAPLRMFNVWLDAAKNRSNDALISAAASPVQVRVMTADEEWMMARHICRMRVGNDS
ncbi:MAG: acetate/propionate family kinase [Chlamydiota bacterium]